MKRCMVIFLALLLLCGCNGAKDMAESSSIPKSYAEENFAYAKCDGATFVLSGNECPLKIGEKIGDYTLTNLVSKLDADGLYSYKATFSADVTVNGNVSYLQDENYGDIIKFYPQDTAVLPSFSGDTDSLLWVTVLENKNPKKLFGITDGTPFFEYKSLNISSVIISFTPHATQTYIQIKNK